MGEYYVEYVGKDENVYARAGEDEREMSAIGAAVGAANQAISPLRAKSRLLE